jgi:hypothetical protein
MSMELMYRILTADEAARIRKSGGGVEALVSETIEALGEVAMRQLKTRPRRGSKLPPDPGGHAIVGTETMLDLHKYWHALHWLLCQDAKGGPEPLKHAILGGRPVGEDLGYGPARLLDAKIVIKVATSLATLDETDLRRRFEPRTMVKAKIYCVDADDDAMVDLLLYAFRKVRDLFAVAATRRAAVLLWLT